MVPYLNIQTEVACQYNLDLTEAAVLAAVQFYCRKAPHSWKRNAEQICNTNIDSLSESDLAVINQTVPRIITFSDKAVQADSLIKENLCLKHCSSWRELVDVLDSIDRVGILYAKP